jgi:TonB family protein
MAKSVGLAPWQPDVTAWCTSAGLTFAGSTLQAKVTPTWLGLLGVMGAVQADRADADSVWCPAWTVDGVEKEVKPRAPEVVVPPPAPAAPVRPAAAPAAPAPKIIPPTPAAFAASSTARSPAPAAQPKAPAPVAAKPQTASNSPAAKPERELPTRAATPAPAPAPKAPAAPVRPAPVPLSAATSELASAAQRPPAPKARPADEQPAAPRSFFKTPAGFAVIGALVVAIGLSVFFYNQSATEKSAALAAKAQAEQRAATEAEALRKAQQQAQIEADARKRAENEIAQKNAAAEVAQKRATEEAKRLVDETNRLLNGRGSLVIVTEPAGATIALSNFAPRVSPATIKDLRLGHYSVNITLPGYDPVNLDVEIKDNATTDPGVIRMVGQFGSIELTTDPADVAYEIRPAGLRISLGGSEIRQGKTPATVGDLPIGDYVVTFKREGWPNHTENVSVERSKSAHVSTKFSGGTVTISSTPAGARVALNGNPLGQTPLTLNDVQPGEVTYSLDLPGFLSTTVTGQVEAEKPLNLNGLLRAQDRIVTPRELDTQPQAIKRVQPNLDREMTDQGGSATISLTVDRDGTTKDLKVETASDPEFGRRCLAAAAQWRFKPGTINGEPVRTRVMLPFKL